MADWRLDQRTEETPVESDITILSRGTSTFKTTFKKIKDFIIGTTTLTTTDTTVTGAIEEVKGIADNNTTQLNDLTQNVNKIWNKEVIAFIPSVDYSLIYNESYRVGNFIIINTAIKRTDEGIINGNFNIGVFQGINNNNIKSLSTTSHSTTTISALNGANCKGLIGIVGDAWISITGTNDTKGVVISTLFVEGGN
ncbi:hypothetical protein CNEO_170038 [Clostridium neonatale]|uniref:hypothetical protein n=1 Tax=Clostridium neonatale TaxID=137838 RepID=UPI001DD7E255|nr:hypothetical protein [Clostridium neonatale]CAG9702579.1 hypothetical protein CNEO_170038 [Clostridium neonatale]